MVAQLSNGQVSRGRCSRSRRKARFSDYGPLWNGWGAGFGWGRGSERRSLGLWLGRLGTVGHGHGDDHHYSGQVLANLQGPGRYMRSEFSACSTTRLSNGGGPDNASCRRKSSSTRNSCRITERPSAAPPARSAAGAARSARKPADGSPGPDPGEPDRRHGIHSRDGWLLKSPSAAPPHSPLPRREGLGVGANNGADARRVRFFSGIEPLQKHPPSIPPLQGGKPLRFASLPHQPPHRFGDRHRIHAHAHHLARAARSCSPCNRRSDRC